jgi:hypothetical protein
MGAGSRSIQGRPACGARFGALDVDGIGKKFPERFHRHAEKQQKGKAFSASPEVQNHRAVLLVLVADNDKVNEVRYDIVTGQLITAK